MELGLCISIGCVWAHLGTKERGIYPRQHRQWQREVHNDEGDEHYEWQTTNSQYALCPPPPNVMCGLEFGFQWNIPYKSSKKMAANKRR